MPKWLVRSLEFGVIELWVQIPAIPLRDGVTLGEGLSP